MKIIYFHNFMRAQCSCIEIAVKWQLTIFISLQEPHALPLILLSLLDASALSAALFLLGLDGLADLERAPERLDAQRRADARLQFALCRLAGLARDATLLGDAVVLDLERLETFLELVQLPLLLRVDLVDLLVLILATTASTDAKCNGTLYLVT